MRIHGLLAEEINGEYFEVAEVYYYYDDTPDHDYSEDPEGTLCQLCTSCAMSAGSDVEHAGNESLIDLGCDICGVYNGEVLEHNLGAAY